MLLATLFGLFPFLKKLFADSAYDGPLFHGALASLLPQLETEIVKRSDRRAGVVWRRKRWIVERTVSLRWGPPGLPGVDGRVSAIDRWTR